MIHSRRYRLQIHPRELQPTQEVGHQHRFLQPPTKSQDFGQQRRGPEVRPVGLKTLEECPFSLRILVFVPPPPLQILKPAALYPQLLQLNVTRRKVIALDYLPRDRKDPLLHSHCQQLVIPRAAAQ